MTAASVFDAKASQISEDLIRTPGSPQFSTYPDKKGLNKDGIVLFRTYFRVPPTDNLQAVLSAKLQLKGLRLYLPPKANLQDLAAIGSKLCVLPSLCSDSILGGFQAQVSGLKSVKIEAGASFLELPDTEIDLLKLFNVPAEKAAEWLLANTSNYADPDYRKIVMTLGSNLHFDSGTLQVRYRMKSTVPGKAAPQNFTNGPEDQTSYKVKKPGQWIRSSDTAGASSAPNPVLPAADFRFQFPNRLLRYERQSASFDSSADPLIEKTLKALIGQPSQNAVKMMLIGYSDVGGTVDEAIKLSKLRVSGFKSKLTAGHGTWPIQLGYQVLRDPRQPYRIELSIVFKPSLTANEKKLIGDQLRAQLNQIWK